MTSKGKKQSNRPLLISISLGVVLLLLFSAFLFSEVRREKEMQINRVTHDYIQFQNQIENFLSRNINLMEGLSAYIETFEQYNDDEIYTFLENLTKNNKFYIKNVGIIQDTTIKWNYPVLENQRALGVDLSKIPDQAASIEYVKSTLNYHFDGPKQLVQGGTGYIIRMPLLKDGRYWGMVSVILKAEKVQELFAGYAADSNLKVAIFNKSNGENLIFGDASIMTKNHLSFDSTFSGNQWTICVVSSDAGIKDWNYLILFSLLGLLIIAIIMRLSYTFFRDAERVKEKNDLLNKEIFRDRLTKIYNRSFLDIRIREEMDLSNRHGAPLSLAYFDLDHFKNVNDKFGHSTGDAVLREIAQTVEADVRASDVFARWGGEEFMILMPATRLLDAVIVAEKIRVLIEKIDHPSVGRVTASFGVAEYFPDEYAGSWFKRVDNALYRSKEKGRNQITASDALNGEESVQYQVKWLEEWNSGNDQIDMDHKELLQMGNNLVEDSYALNNLEDAVARYNELLDRIEAHARREEIILENAGYDGVEAHKASHQALLEKARIHGEQLIENKIDTQFLFVFIMKEVIIGHLVKEDAQYFNSF